MLQSTALFLVFTKEVSLLTIAVCLITLLLHSLFQLESIFPVFHNVSQENIISHSLSSRITLGTDLPASTNTFLPLR